VGFEGMRKEVIAMIVARQNRAEDKKEKTPFMRWSVVYMMVVRQERRVRIDDRGRPEIHAHRTHSKRGQLSNPLKYLSEGTT
jgi:hypothetical protein